MRNRKTRELLESGSEQISSIHLHASGEACEIWPDPILLGFLLLYRCGHGERMYISLPRAASGLIRTMTDIIHQDKLLRFSFDKLDIRGELVYLDESWTNILSRHN